MSALCVDLPWIALRSLNILFRVEGVHAGVRHDRRSTVMEVAFRLRYKIYVEVFGNLSVL